MHPRKSLSRVVRNALAIGLLAFGFTANARAACQLSNGVKHVVYIEFDNQHFSRDNPNVPSDLEQQPNLLNFITHNGTLDAGDHTVLISHTANDILTTQTGLYSDNHGIFVANNFGVYGPALASVFFPSSFFYWTDLVSDITPATMDNTFALTTPSGANVPAPWVPFTRAGCDVGAYSTANIVLERSPFDVKKVFGLLSPQAAETTDQQNADFIGEAIHCAIGSPVCSAANGAEDDLLPSEPGGYNGFKALFGAKYVNTAFGPLEDLDGNVLKNVDTGLVGFTGFDPLATQTLGAVATMLEKGVPVVFAYISDVHDNQEGDALSLESTFGPGEAPYVKQLADYNKAWGQFFSRLKNDGIDQSNTLFVFTPDEGDHNVAVRPFPANCDGAKIVNGAVVPDVPCTSPVTNLQPGVGEVDVDLNLLVAAAGDSTPFAYHEDDAPTVYVPGQPDSSSAPVRKLERTMASLSVVNPHTGLSESLLGTGLGPELQGAMVDATGQRLLHMNSTADTNRSPTFTFFGNPNFFAFPTGSTTPQVFTGDSWNHGDIQPEIGKTFIGIAGPGVGNLGVTSSFFSDHVDVRPTILFLSGLHDDYKSDGRVLTEVIDSHLLSQGLHSDPKQVEALGQAYKAIDAPFGPLATAVLQVSTAALVSDTPGDATYFLLEDKIENWTERRDTIAAQVKAMLDAVEFQGARLDHNAAQNLIGEANDLVQEAQTSAQNL